MEVLWTEDTYKLEEYRLLKDELKDARGLYEIGEVDGSIFTPYYLGVSSVSIYRRLGAHYRGRGNSYLAKDIEQKGIEFWFKYVTIDDALGREAKLLHDYGIGEDGMYRYNKRIESRFSIAALDEALNISGYCGGEQEIDELLEAIKEVCETELDNSLKNIMEKFRDFISKE